MGLAVSTPPQFSGELIIQMNNGLRNNQTQRPENLPALPGATSLRRGIPPLLLGDPPPPLVYMGTLGPGLTCRVHLT